MSATTINEVVQYLNAEIGRATRSLERTEARTPSTPLDHARHAVILAEKRVELDTLEAVLHGITEEGE